MKIINRISNYLNDSEYQIIVKSNQIDIINYDEIIDFSLTKISIKYKKNIFVIEGINLAITKMLDNEVLITGNISNIRIN